MKTERGARPTRSGEGLSNLARKGAWECRNSPPPFLGVLGCAIMTAARKGGCTCRQGHLASITSPSGLAIWRELVTSTKRFWALRSILGGAGRTRTSDQRIMSREPGWNGPLAGRGGRSTHYQTERCHTQDTLNANTRTRPIASNLAYEIDGDIEEATPVLGREARAETLMNVGRCSW
jgi:hypothetical protein